MHRQTVYAVIFSVIAVVGMMTILIAIVSTIPNDPKPLPKKTVDWMTSPGNPSSPSNPLNPLQQPPPSQFDPASPLNLNR
jgi:hypothetical protein